MVIKEKRKIGARNIRLIGEYTRNLPGPLIICICSIHGNEPSGTAALKMALEKLNRYKPTIKGKIIGFLGNVTAFTEKERYIDSDLNRLWTEERIKQLENNYDQFPIKTVEDLEQKFLWTHINTELWNSTGPVTFIDLHTTSSESGPFISINDTLRNRYFALQYPIPTVLGIEEHLDGTILNYINELGHVAMGFEAGQHEEASSVENHESVIWLTLFGSGCIDPNDIPEPRHYYERLAKNTLEEKKIFEVRYRHNISRGEKFKMNPGYINFQKIKLNEKLAIQQNGDVLAGEKGHIFMPLYQSLGLDGFFIIREIKKFWLKVSTILRKKNFHQIIHLLPGVKKYQELDHTIVVNRKIARWYVIELFHLLGFRRKIMKGSRIIFVRRPYDINEPPLPGIHSPDNYTVQRYDGMWMEKLRDSSEISHRDDIDHQLS